MNHEYISVLSELGDLLSRRGEPFRARAYHSASDAVVLLPYTVASAAELEGVKGIGKTVLANLDEYTKTGRIEALERERANPLHTLTRIFGVGPKKAQSFIDKGITTIEDLRANPHLLTNASQAGLRHYDDIEAPIPRDEIDRYDALFKHLMPSIEYAIVGSYRRGAATSGDIDVIITHTNQDVYRQIIDGLIERKVIIEVLSRGNVKCLAIGRLEGGIARRLDFLYAPPAEYAFATLYFTGSKAFNTIQRQRALDMGYSLNEHGLTYLHSGVEVEGDFATEESIFKFLQMDYVPPTKRRSGLLNAGGFDMENANEEQLNARIREANHAYYELGDPTMTDAEYDLLCSTTLRRFPGSVAATEGHTQSAERNKVPLPYEMWSMDKIKPETDALVKWRHSYRGACVLSAKLDGVSGLFTTEGGRPQLYTRGTGVLGQDVSHLIPHLTLPYDIQGVAIRGEFVMPKATFEQKYAAEFANARNLVAGLINQKHPSPERVADVHFVAYEVIRPALLPSSQFEWLNQSGVRVARNIIHGHVTNELLSRHLLEWRADYDYEIDGIICCHDAEHERTSGNPKHAFAFKMVLSEQMAESIVTAVLWTASKDGYLKPRVRIQPVVLGGVTIEYATGFNAQFIQANRVGVGAVVRLVRSGDVIPHIIEVVAPAELPAMPKEPFEWNESGVDVVLVDLANDATVQRKNMTGFFRGVGVEGLSDGNVKRLMDAGYDTVPKIIRMDESDYIQVQGFQAKMARKLCSGIRQRLDKASLPEIMQATNLFGRGFGVKKFAAILSAYNTPNISVEQASSVQGMAHKTASKYVAHLPAFLAWIDETGLHHKIPKGSPNSAAAPPEGNTPLKGKRFVMSGFRDKALADALIAAGAESSTSVSKNTWLVILKDVNDTTGKAAVARKLGVRISTLDEIKTWLYKDGALRSSRSIHGGKSR